MKKKFNVDGMTCAACQSHVEKAVKQLSGVSKVNVNLLKNSMEVEYDNNKCKDLDICDAVNKAGYKAYLPNNKITNTTSKDKSLINLIISIAFLLILMYFSMGNMMWGWPTFKVFDMTKNPMGFALLQFILVLPIVYINRKYFITGYTKLFHKASNMDTLISIGATFSLLYGIYCLFMISLGHTDYHKYLYFESAGMILVFVSIGKYLENLSKKKTTKSLEKLISLAPKKAIKLVNGNEEEVLADTLNVDDIVVVQKGELIPADGIIIEGSASINEANITGESIPVLKGISDNVIASTILTTGYIKVKATRVKDDTQIATIIKLVDEASSSKAPISKLADKISSIFVPTILIISLLVFIGNILYVSLIKPSYVNSNSFEIALNFAVTVIVIACPCALGLATPVAIMVSTGKGAENGLLIKNAEILENAHLIKTVVFDKTGTITNGYPNVTDYISYNDKLDIVSIMLSLEKKSEHPLANAIIDFASKQNKEILDVTDYSSIDGEGISGIINNEFYFLGNIKGIERLKIDYSFALNKIDDLEKQGKNVLILTNSNTLLAIIALKDSIKESSKEAISLLHKEGINTVMLTGDNYNVASIIAKEVGIEKVIANVLPTQKNDVIKSLKTDNKNLVAMVGDGVNDALALTTADIGISMNQGSDIAIETSDIILMKDDLIDVLNAIRLSKRTIKTIKMGLFFAFFYNLICVILATGIFYYISKGSFKMEPMYGSIAMSISSVSVVLNALTINKFKVIKTSNKTNKKEINKMEKITINVEGMMCMHCKAHVEEACKKLDNVINAIASLENNNVVVEYTGDVKKEDLIKSIESAGYKAY